MAKKKKTLFSRIKSAIKKVTNKKATTTTKKTTAGSKSASSSKTTKAAGNAVKKVQAASQKNNVSSTNLTAKNKTTAKQISSLKSNNNAQKSNKNTATNNTALKKAVKKLVTETKKTDAVTGRFRTAGTKQTRSVEKIGGVAEKVTKKATKNIQTQTVDELVQQGSKGLSKMQKNNEKVVKAVKKAAENKRKDEENKLTRDERIKVQKASMSTTLKNKGAKYSKVEVDDKIKEKQQWNAQRFFDNANGAEKTVMGFASGLAPFTDSIKEYERKYGVKIDAEKFKESKYYKTGDVLGFITSSVLTGAGIESATVKGLTRAVAKVAGKKAAEKTGTKVATGIAADVASGLPMNIADASENTDNAKDFLKNLGINTALDAGVGGLINGVRLLKGVNSKEVQAVADKVKAGKALNASDKKVIDDLKEIADSSSKQAENAKSVEKQAGKSYNDSMGGIENGKEQVRTDTVSANTGRTEDIRQTESGVQLSGSVGYDRQRIDRSSGTAQLEGTRRSTSNVLLNSKTKEKMNANGIVDTKLDSTDYAIFSAKLDEARSTNPRGSFVDSQSVENLANANAKVFLSDDGSVGVAVKEDGDICGAFNSGKTYKGAVSDMLITARANGGTKMDCYGYKLVRMYEKNGFVPVAKVKFDPRYVDDPLLLSEQPDVYVMMKNTDDIDTVVDNVVNKNYKMSTLDDLDKLPVFEYDEAMAYRDRLLAAQETRLNGSTERLDVDKMPELRKTAGKIYKDVDDRVAEIFEPSIKNGKVDKIKTASQKDAVEQALKELDDGTLLRNFLDSSVENNEHLFMARASILMDDLAEKSKLDPTAADTLSEVFEKTTEIASYGGRLLNSVKILYKASPEGRVKTFEKDVARLNREYGDRLKNGKLELTDEQKRLIREAKTEEEMREVGNKIQVELFEQIPATFFEKANEFRHFAMLFNPKTHFRNALGNAVFKSGRMVAESLEIAAYKLPAIRKKLDSLGGKVEMVHVPHSEVKAHRKELDEIFDRFYKNSDSKNRYIESSRPDGVGVTGIKGLDKLIQTNYKLLEAEDLVIFKPEYRKNFTRWCKANGVSLDDLGKMTTKQLNDANLYALRQAEYATFRDASALSDKIIKLKQKTAGYSGNNKLLYRAGNVALESVMPFVKTPVNILRRSLDFSPVGLMRGTAKLARAKTADEFMTGVKKMTTGLSGTGIYAFGAWLASRDLITVKAGEESGDAYYDRDMGYQDYSLVFHLGGKEYSATIDWVSPLQTSLFMGATTYNNWTDDTDGKRLTVADLFDCMNAVAGPMLDMSFMSSAKDTIEMFMETVYRNGTGEDANWSGAIYQTLFGSLPQGYLSSFIPQLFSQTAQATDKYQRDTRSTKEDPLAKSWESFGRKIANRIPGLRNYILNPKLDRFGNDKVTGNNVVLRFINAYLNPSNVKEIKLTKTDKEIIDIYNHLESEDDKKYFYYNFTGNPSYDLGNGKRMTYDQAYKYGKEKRKKQAGLIETMINSKSYKNMTYKMKGDEVNDAHWISQTVADWKTHGAKFAVKRIIDFKDGEKNAYNKFNAQGGTNKEFMEAYVQKESLIARAHDTSYQTKALALASLGDDRLAKAYGVYGDKMNAAKEYLKKGGSLTEYSNAMCNIISTIQKSGGTSTSMASKALAAAEHKINMRTYNAMGIDSQLANMGVGLKKFGYDFQTLEDMEMDALTGFDADGNNSLKKSEVIAYIESLGLKTNAEKACVFRYFSDAKNPYGSIPNYLGGADTSDGGSSSGRSGSSKKSSASGKEKTEKKELSDFEKYTQGLLKDIQDGDFVDNPKYHKLNTADYGSDAYRKAIAKLLAKKLKES